MTDNEIIARFMGVYQDNPEYFKNSYDTSWDWLMPVVEKIESLGFKTVASQSDICANIHYINIITGVGIVRQTFDNPSKFMGTSNTKIESYYKAVVDFIKWYNSQNP